MKNEQPIPYFSVEDPYHIVYRKGSTSYPVKPHTHNAMEIYFSLSDLPDVLLNDTISGVPAGSLIVIPPYNVHQLFSRKLPVYERYIVTVRSSWLEAVLDHNTGLMEYASADSHPAVIPLPDTEIKLLRRKLDDFLKKHSKPSMAAYADLFSLLNTLDGCITEGLSNRLPDRRSISKSQETINEIIAYINRHLTEQLTLEQIAAAFYLNKDYLARLFKEHTHATIGHYISVQRASLAQTMLAEGRTVSEVQEALGFSSYAYFFKFFQKMTGLSPSQYRKQSK